MVVIGEHIPHLIVQHILDEESFLFAAPSSSKSFPLNWLIVLGTARNACTSASQSGFPEICGCCSGSRRPAPKAQLRLN